MVFRVGGLKGSSFPRFGGWGLCEVTGGAPGSRAGEGMNEAGAGQRNGFEGH